MDKENLYKLLLLTKKEKIGPSDQNILANSMKVKNTEKATSSNKTKTPTRENGSMADKKGTGNKHTRMEKQQ